MLLVTDVGNTNIKLGLYDGERLAASWRLSTDLKKTSDEYGLMLMNLLSHAGAGKQDISGAIMSSVVPGINYTLTHMLEFYLGQHPLLVGPGIKTGLNIKLDNPRELGGDLITDAISAFTRYGGDLIVIDFGTATTMSAVTAHGEFLGGCILPGVRVAVDALTERAAKLPKIDLELPKSVIGRNTVSCMQAGLLYGYVGQLEYLVSAFKQEMNAPQARVVATGGMSGVIAGMTKCINITDRLLTLEGLRILYKLNAG